MRLFDPEEIYSDSIDKCMLTLSKWWHSRRKRWYSLFGILPLALLCASIAISKRLSICCVAVGACFIASSLPTREWIEVTVWSDGRRTEEKKSDECGFCAVFGFVLLTYGLLTKFLCKAYGIVGLLFVWLSFVSKYESIDTYGGDRYQFKYFGKESSPVQLKTFRNRSLRSGSYSSVSSDGLICADAIVYGWVRTSTGYVLMDFPDESGLALVSEIEDELVNTSASPSPSLESSVPSSVDVIIHLSEPSPA
jgi:hypothetical protein